MKTFERNNIYIGDCLCAMRDMDDNSVDVFFTSPPYADRGDNDGGRVGAHNTHQKYLVLESHTYDWLEWQIQVIDELLRISRKLVIYNVQGISSNRTNVYSLIGHYADRIHDTLIWYKESAQPSGTKNVINNRYEFILLIKPDGIDRVKCNSNSMWNAFVLPSNKNIFSNFHGAVMSQPLSDMIIREFTDEGDLVCDPFFGLGTTAISCKKFKRDYIGFEICEKYDIKAKHRISEAQSHKRLFLMENTMIVIYNENCMDTMNRMVSSGETVDIILTSPPYNTGKAGTSQNSRDNYQSRYDVYDECLTDAEYISWSKDLFAHYDSILNPNGVILYNISYGAEHPDLLWILLSHLIQDTDFMVADCLIWKKNSALPANQNPNKMTRVTEFVFVFCRRSEYDTFKSAKIPMGNGKYSCWNNFIDARNNDGANELNKATFSTDFVEQLLVRYATDGMTVYDSFMGTGTTAVACKRRGLNCIGSELSPAQVEFANEWLDGERFVQNKNVKKLF